MQIALFRNQFDNEPKVAALEWGELAGLLTKHRRTPCDPCKGKHCAHKTGVAWSCVEVAPCPPKCRMHGTKSDCGGGQFHRLNDNVVAVHAAVFDVDHAPLAEVFALAGRLEAAGLAAIIHSSHSHSPPDDCCVRVVLRLTRPATVAEWPRLRAALEARFGIPADKSTKDQARLFFLPSAPSQSPVIAASQEGAPVNVDEVLAGYVPPAPAPLVHLAPRPSTDEMPPADMGELRKRLRARAGKYADSAREGDAERAALLVRVLKGEPLSEEGGRDNAIQQACSLLATNLPLDTPEFAILELLRESLNGIPGAPESSEGRDWHEVAQRKLARAMQRREAFVAERKDGDRQVLEKLMRESALSDDEPEQQAANDDAGMTVAQVTVGLEAPAEHEIKPGGYTVEALERWAEEQGTTLEGFQRRWIIQKGKAFYVFVGGRYRTPITRDDLFVSLPRDLARAPVTLTADDANGNTRRIGLDTLLDSYATVARDVQASLALQRSYYDPRTETFFEAARPLRKIKPREHPEIQRWLELLGGRDADKLIAWVATVSRLDRQSCAIYFDGVKGSGKTLFANGLARLWHAGGASELHRVLDGFNDSLTVCPLLFADESLPAQKGITAELRRLIGSTSRSLRRLYMPTCSLDGAVRVIVAGNNDRLLDTGEDLSANDLDAVAGRFLYVKAGQPAADYLLDLGGPPVVGRWITHDMLAEHSLWLRDTWKVQEGSRFLVEGEAREFHDHLATGSGFAGLVCEWLVRYLCDPKTSLPPAVGQPQLVLAGEGELWVSTDALASDEAWVKRVPSAKVPSATKIGKALRNLSSSSERVRVGERQVTFHRVKLSLLLSWAERSHVGDVDEMRKRVAEPSVTIATAKAARGLSAA